MDRGETDTGSFSHVDGALLCQIHVVEVDELKLGLFLWPEQTNHCNKKKKIHEYSYLRVLGKPINSLRHHLRFLRVSLQSTQENTVHF